MQKRAADGRFSCSVIYNKNSTFKIAAASPFCPTYDGLAVEDRRGHSCTSFAVLFLLLTAAAATSAATATAAAHQAGAAEGGDSGSTAATGGGADWARWKADAVESAAAAAAGFDEARAGKD